MTIKVEVKVTAPEIVEAVNRLAEVLPNLANEQSEKLKPEKVGSTEPKAEQKSKSAESKKAADETAAAKEPEAKEVSLEEVRAKLASLSQDGKQAEVKALITEFGAKKLSDIPAEKYPELLTKAEGLQ